MALAPSQRSFRLMLVYQVTQHVPLYWPYMLYYVTSVRGLPASDFGLLKSIYYFGVMTFEVPFGVVADRLGRKVTLVLGALGYAAGCALYASGKSFAAFALGELCAASATALQSGADSALLFDAYAADGRTHEFARARGALESAGLVGATVALSLGGLLVTSDGDPSLTYWVTVAISLVGFCAALLLREPPRRNDAHLRAHLRETLRDLVRIRGLVATILFSALIYLGLRASSALVWHPVLHAGGVPLRAYGALTAVATLVAAWTAWRAHAWLARFGERSLLFACGASVTAMFLLLPLAPGAAGAALLVTHGFAMGIVPPVVADLLNRRISNPDRRATLLSFESLVIRGSYGVLVIPAAAALDHSLALVLLGFALTSALATALVPLATRESAVRDEKGV